ncbi:S1 family peptidase [Celeribacter sp.]|uniref:S1 family peptidase n=1 Tax=Celeribacter sp. TaxID=1890673 RepID=UPI003A8F87E2
MIRTLFVIVFAVVLPFASLAQDRDFDYLFDDFRATNYTKSELRFLQLGLTLEGFYNGLLDGAWGRISNSAIERYSLQEFDEPPKQYHAALLAYTTLDFLTADDWSYEYFDSLGLSFLVPDSLVQGETSANFVNFEHLNSSLKLSVTFDDSTGTSGIHDYAIGFAARGTEPYTVRKQGFAVTSSTNSVGDTLYVRSNYWKGQWATVLLSTNARDKGILAAISASITSDPNATLYIPENGFLLSVAESTADLVARIEEENASNPLPDSFAAAPKPRDEGSARATGSGFYVSNMGHVLTNAHVVKECNSLSVDGAPAELVQTSSSFDLALLKRAGMGGKTVAEFSPAPARLNEDITVVGYPLASILGGLNVTRGAISSLKGLDGDEVTLQISAPVQPGNSGGPALSEQGYVKGVVVSKLDAFYVADAIGDIPQNVNFAIRGEAAKLFLGVNGVTPRIGIPRDPLDPVDLAEQAQSFTAFIECH